MGAGANLARLAALLSLLSFAHTQSAVENGNGGSVLCSMYSFSCQTCLIVGCSFQNPGGCQTECSGDSRDPNTPTCFSGHPIRCPQPDCGTAPATCEGCLSAGCAWEKSGQCGNVCQPGDPECLPPGTQLPDCISKEVRCGRNKRCDECVASDLGCVFQGGKCVAECDRPLGRDAFIAGGCVDKDSLSQGLTCPVGSNSGSSSSSSSSSESSSSGGVSQAVPNGRGYCNWGDCNGYPSGDDWCDENAPQCVTGCRGSWCPSDGFCSAVENDCGASIALADRWCSAKTEQCTKCGGKWCLY